MPLLYLFNFPYQIELYAENSDNLDNVLYTQDERGFAFDNNFIRSRGLTLSLLTVIHILLNAAFALASTYLIAKYHKSLHQVKGKRYQVVASLYWSVVFLCFVGVISVLAGNSYLYYALSLIEDESSEAFGFRITSDIMLGILIIIEFFASIFTPHDPNFFIPHLIRRTLCCNQCCYCCGSQSRRHFLRKAILSIAMWIIVVFFQVIISSLLPVVIVIVLNPVPSLAFLSIMVSLFFCLVVFIAYFLNAFEGNYISTHKLSKENRRKSSLSIETLKRNHGLAGEWAREKLVLIAQAFIFLVIFGIISLVVIIYLNFVRAGANANTVGGLFFSLVPSVVLGGITWVAKKHLFREFEEEPMEEITDLNGEEDNIEEEGFFKFGNIKIGTKTRRRSRRLSKKSNTIDSSENGDMTNAQNKASYSEENGTLTKNEEIAIEAVSKDPNPNTSLQGHVSISMDKLTSKTLSPSTSFEVKRVSFGMTEPMNEPLTTTEDTANLD